MSFDSTQQIWDETPDAIVAVSLDGRVELWNCAAEIVFGFTAEEAVGELLTELIVPADHGDEEQRIREQA